MLTPELVISAEPTPGEVQYLEDRLYEFNSAVTGITDGEWLAIFVRDDNHRIVAGICGNTWDGCAEIRMLLMTFSFQAPAFYAKHGFEVVAVVDDHPHGHKNMLLRKRLGAA